MHDVLLTRVTFTHSKLNDKAYLLVAQDEGCSMIIKCILETKFLFDISFVKNIVVFFVFVSLLGSFSSPFTKAVKTIIYCPIQPRQLNKKPLHIEEINKLGMHC